MKETELVKRLMAGDREAFDALYELYKDQAFRTAWFLSGNRTDAEDIVQDTFVKVYVNIGQLKSAEGFRSWFYRILTRTAWKQSDSRKREFPDEEILIHADIASEAAGDGNPEQIFEREERKKLRAIVDRLDEKYRTTLILYYYSECSTKAIASIMGCLEGTVKSRLFSARRKVKTELMREMKKEGAVYEQEGRRSNQGIF
ncbi:MAG: RNA polymerase sigma factor [Clostridium sp.]|nr:RNA polymerase sigma factor [Clostridium sp.]